MKINTSLPLNTKLAYIQARRKGFPAPNVQLLFDENQKRLETTASQFTSTLMERREQANGVIGELLEGLKSHQFLQPLDFQNQNLQETVEKLEQIQTELKAQLDRSQEEAKARKDQRAELQKLVEHLRRRLNSPDSQYFPHQNELLEVSSMINRSISLSNNKNT